MTAVLLNVAMMILAVGGFFALALASDRPGSEMIGRKAKASERLGLRLTGWPLLVLALSCGIFGWGNGVGMTTWIAWLTLAGSALVFVFPVVERARERRDPKARPRRPAPPVPLSPPLRSMSGRALVLVLLIGAPLVFLGIAAFSPSQPVLREDAVQGQVGPWTFSLAEFERRAPKIMLGEHPTKTFQIRFCDACDDEIRSAYLKVNKPRSLRAAGMAFGSDRWNRSVEINLPNSTKPESEVWLTVEGKDGTLHYASWPVAELSPATANWLQGRKQDP